MRTFILRRIIFMILSIVAATLIVFILSRLQGDPRYLMLNTGYTTPEIWEEWGRKMHLDKPVAIQYFYFMYDGLIKWDFGVSLKTSIPSMEMVRSYRCMYISRNMSCSYNRRSS